MSFCIAIGGCDWFEFKLWDGKSWVLARCCKRHRCPRQALHDGYRWAPRNLRLHRAP